MNVQGNCVPVVAHGNDTKTDVYVNMEGGGATGAAGEVVSGVDQNLR